jgi:putative membrane protein
MTNPNRRTLADHLRLTLYGMIMGAADVVPGVSGGTMAFILGIYNELIDSIRAAVPFLRLMVSLKWREAFKVFPWKFLLSIGAGIAIAIISLASLIRWALETHPVLVYSLFFGLIVASVFVVRSRIKAWRLPIYLTVAAAAVAAFFLVGMRPAETPEALWFVFLSGMIAICAMILPGISGAFILVLLGKYHFILHALTSINIPVIIVFMLGAATGIITFANILRWLLNNYHDITVAALIGLMIGSLRELWPWKSTVLNGDLTGRAVIMLPPSLSSETIFAIALMIVGFALVMALEHVASKRQSQIA